MLIAYAKNIYLNEDLFHINFHYYAYINDLI
jgi:hypothetical protein